MRALVIVRVIAIVAIGLLAGVYLGDRVAGTPARAGLSSSGFVQFQQIVHVYFVRLLPLLTISAAIGGLAWLVILRARWRTTEFWLVAISTVAIIFIFAVTRAINLPINDQLMTWSVSAPPPNIRELWSPWEQIHTIRTIVAVIAFVLEVVALSLSTSNKPAPHSFSRAR